MDDLEKFITDLIKDEYIKEDGTLLKCIHCSSRNLDSTVYWEEHMAVERVVHCEDCGEQTGVWSYGSWHL